MKMRTVRRAIVILCLMCILAACARESAPAEAPAVDAAAAFVPPSSAGPAWFENSGECLRIISGCLGQSKLSQYGTVSPDSGTAFAG